ncbi:hypothetical protein LCGC14_1592570 [marine sediment metagenome]|uniref:Uncharacterized protein n=1 Tax=marine sediment metagenome TaxID=412755 RepID=A0A0F9IZW6_9ZZZZ
MKGNKQKKRNRLTIIILFFILFLVPIISFSTYVLAVDKPTISADLLAITPGNFVDNTPNDGSGMLKIVTGGSDLNSFNNLGVESWSADRKTVLFRAEAIFGFEMTAHTDATWQDIYPQGITQREDVIYFQYGSQWHGHILGFDLPSKWIDRLDLHTSWNSFNFGPEYRRHDYNGKIPITVTIDPGLKFGGDIVVDGKTFTVPKIIPDIVKVIVVNYRKGEVGEYEDIYTQSTVDPSGSVEIVIITDEISGESKNYIDWFNSQGVGRITQYPYTDVSIQPSITEGDQINAEYPETDDSNTLTFDYGMRLQPEVYKTTGNFKLIGGIFNYDTTHSKVIQDSVKEVTFFRDISIHVNNQYVYVNFIVKVYFVMTVEFDAALSTSILSDPNLEFSDIIWEASIDVQSGKIALPPKPGSWWEDILGWLILFIVLIAGLYIFIKLGIPLILRRQRKTSYKRGR